MRRSAIEVAAVAFFATTFLTAAFLLTTGFFVATTALGCLRTTLLTTGFFGATFFTAVTFCTTFLLLGPLPFCPETTICPFSTATAKHALVQSAAHVLGAGTKNAISNGAVIPAISALDIFIVGAG